MMNEDMVARMARRRQVIGLSVAVGFLVMLLCVPWALQAQDESVLEVGKFSIAPLGDTLPDGWKPWTFQNIPKHTVYSVVRDGERTVVKAVSEVSASGMTREIRIDPKEYPIIQWEWKVTNVLEKGDVSRKEGDDYPARIYITFEYDSGKVGLIEKAKFEALRLLYGQYPPTAINYIWESKSPIGTVVPNPFTDRVKMIVVGSGAENLNTWVGQQRNIYEDYKQAFGEEPPMVSGVAIMTDTDNTGEAATAYYGDIVFLRAGI